MGFFKKVKERKEAFMKIRASNIEKRKKKRSERVAQMKKENKLYREEAKARKEYQDLKKENFRHKTRGIRKLGAGLEKLGGGSNNKQDNRPYWLKETSKGGSNPFTSSGKSNSPFVGGSSSSPFVVKPKTKTKKRGKSITIKIN